MNINEHSFSFRAIVSGVILAFWFASGNAAFSATLVDTGPVADPYSGNQWIIGGDYVFAAEFSLAQESTITSAAGWFGINRSGFDFNIRIYGQISGGLPGSALYSGLVSVPSQSPTGEQNEVWNWYGLGNLDWMLPTGTYWISYEGVNSSRQFAIMPGPAPNPLAHYARNDFSTNFEWDYADFLEFGVRIEGNPVPLPASLWLFISGIASLCCLSRNKARKKSEQ